MKISRANPIVLCLFAIIVAAGALAADLPTPEEYRANWPRFRGPDGGGVSTQSGVPLTCDLKSGANILWSTEVPAAGFNSPVVWGERVFLSGGDEEKREVMCFEVASGKLLWKSAVPKAEGDDKIEVPDQSGMAAPSVATDGRRVYAIFANGDLGAFNFNGSTAWSKHLAVSKNQYGHASSLLTWQDRVIVQLDQGEADDKLSRLTAFDGATGAVVWERARAVGASWATPIVCDAAAKAQIVTLANPLAISYSAKDGTELWRADILDGEITPSPVFTGGTLFIVSPSNKLQAIRTDGSGDVTKTHLGWVAEDGIPDITSPVTNGELIFVITSSGMLTCYDAKTGKKQWEHEFEEDCKASPSIVGDKLVVITMKGTIVVLGASREFQEVSRSALGEQVFASPAFAKGIMLVRGVKHLICIGTKK
ncbi:MAG: PQQ-binding-like beta-propeller repeat protein [Chthoniobacteraceae bacterium]